MSTIMYFNFIYIFDRDILLNKKKKVLVSLFLSTLL